MISVENLSKRFGSVVAVDEVSFQVEKDEVVGFLGPNGAGKTTTMRILACFIPATSGTAKVAGYDVFAESLKARRELGYMPENVPAYNDMRVQEYLSYRGKLKGLRRRDRRRRLGEVMERCWIGDVSRKLIGQLSKGYRQRVGLAEALIHDPKILILDEPTLGLDPNQIRETRALIRELGEDHTILLSTHILPEAEMVCGRVIIISRGRIVAMDTPENLMSALQKGAAISLEVRGPGENIKSVLEAIPEVQRVEWRQRNGVHNFVIQVSGEADVREEVFQRCAKNGWVIRELKREMMALEDIFYEITMREPEVGG